MWDSAEAVESVNTFFFRKRGTFCYRVASDNAFFFRKSGSHPAAAAAAAAASGTASGPASGPASAGGGGTYGE